MAQRKKLMENQIRLLTESLQPSEEQVRHGKSVMNKVFRKLQKESRFSIDRCMLVGGTEKKTSICMKLDFDCVVYVNNTTYWELQSDEVLDDFEDVLLLNFEIDKENIRKASGRTLMVTINGVDFDLSIAPNFIFGQNMNADAMLQTFESIWRKNKPPKEKKKEMDRLSPAVSWIAVQFIKEQSSFLHELARLCKFWNKTVFLELELNNSYVSGRSSIMELLAIDAGLEEERRSKSLLSGFRRFLVRVRDIESSKLIFKNSFYDTSKVPNEIKREPYIIDPANPYHNYLEGVGENVLHIWSACAKASLVSLDNAERGVQSVFNPHPKWFRSSVVTTPQNWLVSTRSVQNKEPTYKVNKGRPTEKYIKILKNYLTIIVKSVEPSCETHSLNHKAAIVQEKVTKEISTSIIGSHANWCDTDETHSSRECTITIPFDSGKKAVLISCDWS